MYLRVLSVAPIARSVLQIILEFPVLLLPIMAISEGWLVNTLSRKHVLILPTWSFCRAVVRSLGV
jgi:hypothetical protein